MIPASSYMQTVKLSHLHLLRARQGHWHTQLQPVHSQLNYQRA